MLKYRLLTACLLLPILLCVIFLLPSYLFAVFMAVIIFLVMREWLYLAGIHAKPLILSGSFAIALVCLLASFVPPLPIFICAFVIWIWGTWAVIRYIQQKPLLGLQHKWIQIIVGILMFIAYWKAAVLLQQLSPRPWWLLFGIFLIWAADCGAYTFGRLFGKNKPLLAPTISPGKTRIGFWGGLLFGLIVTLIFAWFMPLDWLQRLILLLISMFIVFISVIGDLFESMIKRQAGVKDSGELLPGHGGMLDRLDSTISALPILMFALLVCKFFGVAFI